MDIIQRSNGYILHLITLITSFYRSWLSRIDYFENNGQNLCSHLLIYSLFFLDNSLLCHKIINFFILYFGKQTKLTFPWSILLDFRFTFLLACLKGMSSPLWYFSIILTQNIVTKKFLFCFVYGLVLLSILLSKWRKKELK